VVLWLRSHALNWTQKVKCSPQHGGKRLRIEVHEGMAAVLVEEQAPPDAGDVQSILDLKELQEQMYTMLLQAGKEMKNGKISSPNIWR
jgi:hypothetical protein